MVLIKSSYLIFLTVIFSIITYGCNKIEDFAEPSPKEALNGYLSALLKDRHKKVYSFVSSEDKKVKTLGVYVSEKSENTNSLTSIIANKSSFSIVAVDKTGDKATAEVKLTYPDMGIVLKDFFRAGLAAAFGGGGDENVVVEQIAKNYEGKELPTTTETRDFNLVKEKDGWKVFLDWKAEKERLLAIKKKAEKGKKVKALLKDANQLRMSKKLSAATAKYHEVLELDGDTVEAINGLKESEDEIQKIKEKNTYIKNVKLYKFKAKYYETYSRKKTPGVNFKIKNEGNRTLNEVQVTIYFMDSDGSVIHETKFHPILDSTYSFGKNNAPLKPNYIWQLERGKFYSVDTVPSEWKEGAASAKVTNIEFLE